MTGIGDDLKGAVTKEDDTHTKSVVAATKAAATPDNGGDDPDVELQVVAVLKANPPSWVFLVHSV